MGELNNIDRMESPQTLIQNLLDQLIAEGKERGLQVAAYVRGELVVNAWAGVADGESKRPVEADTLFPIFSVTKGIATTIIHRLVERGRLSYDEPIAAVWPEFGAHGKDRITLREGLNHSAGLPHMPRGIGFGELCDWESMCAAIADLTPSWPPGSRIEYHAMTWGWIVGETARRADGRSFSQLLDDEIRQPLGLEAMYVGIPDAVASRVAILDERGMDPPAPDDDVPRSVPGWIGPLHGLMNRADARRACIPASNGIMSALAMARHYAALLPGGVDGVELLPASRVGIATEMQKPARATDDNQPKCWGLGYQIGCAGSIFGESAVAFGHGGYGGSIGFADTSLGLAMGLTKNFFHKEDTPRLIVDTLRGALR